MNETQTETVSMTTVPIHATYTRLICAAVDSMPIMTQTVHLGHYVRVTNAPQPKLEASGADEVGRVNVIGPGCGGSATNSAALPRLPTGGNHG